MAQISGPTAFFDKTYNEALALTEQAHAYLSEIQHNNVRTGSPIDDLRLRCEAFRLSTRLMQVMAWLLNQRAIHAGELTVAEVSEGAQYRLGCANVCRDDSQHQHPAIPATMGDMLDQSLNLYIRTERLDEMMHPTIH
jgi:regulator of CtrA degradation